MVILRNGEKFILNTFLHQLLKSYLFQEQVEKISFGSAQPQLTIKELKKFLMSLPSLQEQEKIAGVLDSVDNKLNILMAKHEHYTILKRGLMNKLLAGKLRVKF
jgi:type I restriction enzyme S subunit